MSYEHTSGRAVTRGVPPRETRKRAFPNRRPDRAWGGPGAGAECALCNTSVPPGEFEYEVDFLADGEDAAKDTYHVHVSCYLSWMAER